MRKFLTSLFYLQTLFLTLLFFAPTAKLMGEASAVANKISWITSYEEAVNQSTTSSKPILLFFTGSDHCPWCHKLEDEVFNTQDFINTAGNKFIFVMLDSPANVKLLPAQLLAQNQQLKKKYHVRGLPTVVVIDSKGQKIGEIYGFQAGGKKYADQLLKMVNNFSGYQHKVGNLQKENFSGEELKQLYEKAQEFGLESDALKIIATGIQSDEKAFFLLEKYRYLSYEGQQNSTEAQKLKKQLFEIDPKNENLTHYHVAISDFEALGSSLESHHKTAAYLVKPLTDYIYQFEKSDKTNLWRLHMIISQVYYDKDEKEEALQHAKMSLKLAPISAKSEIEIIIKNITLQFLSPLANSSY